MLRMIGAMLMRGHGMADDSRVLAVRSGGKTLQRQQ